MVRYNFEVLILLLGFFSCTHQSQGEIYPELVTERNLEELYDRAKYEVYKLNSIPPFAESSLAVSYPKDIARTEKYRLDMLLKSYQEKGKREKDLQALAATIGEENLRNFWELDLDFHKNPDNLKGDTTKFVFFAKTLSNGFNWSSLSPTQIYSIWFSNGNIIGAEEGSGIVYDYSDLETKSNDQAFISIIENGKGVNPWLKWYKATYIEGKKLSNLKK